MKTSVIIATYNRAQVLRNCLLALTALTMDRSLFEIIVVDNNSPDETSDVVRSLAAAYPDFQLHYHFHKEQGVAGARNSGVAIAQGEYICFLDDDTIPAPDWLTKLLQGFQDQAVGCVGGPAILDFQGHMPPPWLDGDLKGLLSGYGLPYYTPTKITEVAEYPFSCNMAVRRTALDQVGVFRPDLDRSGKGLLAGAETELIGRIYRAGWTIIYLPDAKVLHLVSPERLKKQYIYRVGIGLAATHVYLTSERRIRSVARWFASDGWYTTRMLWKLIISLSERNPLWFDDYMRFWMVAQRLPIRVRALVWGASSITNLAMR